MNMRVHTYVTIGAAFVAPLGGLFAATRSLKPNALTPIGS